MAGSYQTCLKAAKRPKRRLCHYKMNFIIIMIMTRVKIRMDVLLICKQGTKHAWVTKYG